MTLEITADDLLAAPPGAFDVVLIGDLFYERPLAERVLAFAEAAHARGALVLAGDPRRSYFPQDRFQPARRILGARHARAGGRRDQAHRRVALRSGRGRT